MPNILPAQTNAGYRRLALDMLSLSLNINVDISKHIYQYIKCSIYQNMYILYIYIYMYRQIKSCKEMYMYICIYHISIKHDYIHTQYSSIMYNTLWYWACIYQISNMDYISVSNSFHINIYVMFYILYHSDYILLNIFKYIYI